MSRPRRAAWRHILVALAPALALAAASARADYTTMINNGPSSNRVDIVFQGDGYLASQIETTYVTHINAMLNHMFNEAEDPFPRYRNYFNVHRINVVSNQTGADVPPQGIFRDTALDARYYYDGVTERLLYINQAKADAIEATQLAAAGFTAEMRLVTVNDTKYGGGGGKYAVYAGGNTFATEVALHELGHSFSGLADEYGGTPGAYPGAEPGEINVTKDSGGAKWSQWLGYNQPGIGVIGAYEGGRYYDQGIYRPSLDSKMRSLDRPFDAISREKIILDIYNLVDPLDSWLDNGSLLVDPASLWVDRIDDAVISMQWFVDGVLVAGATGDHFDLRAFGYGPGLYSVRARAYDPTDWVRINLDRLEESISWRVQLSVPEPGSLALVGVGLIGVIAFGRRRLRAVG